MKSLILLLSLFISIGAFASPGKTFSYSSLNAKKKSNSNFDRTRILVGPGFGFGAGFRAFSFNISPSIAYCLTDNFHVGTTLGFNYYQQSVDYTNVVFPGKMETYKFKLPAYSFSVYARYLLANFLLLNFEPELNNTKFILNYPFQYPNDFNLTTGKVVERSTREFIPSVLVGAGYAQRFGNYGYSYLMLCYDIVQNPNARYYQTIDFRVGIMISLWNK